MTFEQLDFFITTVQSETFFDAAEKLHTTQSTLSKQMKKLEKELDLTLWDRSRRSAVLTPAGEAFYKEALKLSHQYHAMLHTMQAFRQPDSRTVCLGTLPILSQYGLTAPLNRFAKLHPKVHLSIFEVEEQELLSGFSQDKFDLILARETMIDQSLCHFCPVATDRLCVMLPAAHPLAGKSQLSLSEIAGENFILMHPYTSIYQLCQKLFEQAGITPHILRTARMESIISAVQFGEAISLFPESNFNLFRHPGVVAVPLSDAPELRIGIASKKEPQSDSFCAKAICEALASSNA